jgi:hypothetical protein
MKWVTRSSIRVNRTATAWLIRRFIDAEATFEFVAADRVAEVQAGDGAIGFDAPGARYPHKDDRGRCSFEALVDEHCADDAALRELARIVHSADFREDFDRVPEAAGLFAISQGFPLVATSDPDTMERARFLYDALYAFLEASMRGTPPPYRVG